ncbi:MAG TPA: N-acetyltransferase [Thermoplasmata archaeon]|nr:N-acetyltransferase [Thermoplasmata archaeon]
MDLRFDAMTKEHSKEVMDIFNHYVVHSFAAYPESPLPNEFFNKFMELTKGYPAFVIRYIESGKVVGFCFLRAYNPFPVFRETAEITYFLEKEEVGKGIGTKALEKLEEEAKKIGIKTLLADISSENTQSIVFHKKKGFRECGRFHRVGKKKGKSFDVVWMEKTLGD